MNNLYSTNRGIFWLFTSILAGIFFGAFQSDIRAGIIYGVALFVLAMLYEIFINKENRPRK